MLVATVTVVSTVAVAGCGSAVDISGGRAASLTAATFVSQVRAATPLPSSVHLQGTLTGTGQQVVVTADVAADGTAFEDVSAALSIQVGATGAVEIRVVGGAFYLDTSSLGMGFPSTKPWLKIDPSDTGNPMGQGFGQVFEQFNLAQVAEAFSAATAVESLGSAEVDGVATTHYRVRVDTHKLLTILAVDPSLIPSDTPRLGTLDVWVDGKYRPVRVQSSSNAFAADLHFSRWGEPVTVTAPPAGQVASF
ncbi:MAG: LppX_LprAFG lipoprotein [Nocardioidaceae bacterium]